MTNFIILELTLGVNHKLEHLKYVKNMSNKFQINKTVETLVTYFYLNTQFMNKIK